MSTDAAEDNIGILDQSHQKVFRRAIINILSTSHVENTYAQILDGLPTIQSLQDSYDFIEGHPVFELDHAEICDGFVEKARELKSRFEPSDLRFKPSLLYAFQNEPEGSRTISLRLIELIVTACHQIAASLYQLDSGAHKHDVFDCWLKQKLAESILRSKPGRAYGGAVFPVAPFAHSEYMFHEKYPSGMADVVGYWAEGQIFGGVVLFDRGETEQECKSMWIHGARSAGPQTLYPPTTEQFDSLMSFLLSDLKLECPLPIHGTVENRPRWNPWHAFAQYHIFRERHEREVSPDLPRRGCTIVYDDWPELGDSWLIDNLAYIRSKGKVVTEDEISAAQRRLREITPSSPLWRGNHNSYR